MPKRPRGPNYSRGKHAIRRDRQEILQLKDKILELAESLRLPKKKQIKAIKEYLSRVEKVSCSNSLLNSVLIEWGVNEPPKRNPRKPAAPKLSRPTVLLPFKEDILRWNGQGLDASEIRARLHQKFNKDVRVTNIENVLAIWSPNLEDGEALPASWRPIEEQPRPKEFPTIPLLPANVLLQNELQILKQGIQELYLRAPAPQTNPTGDWPERIANALCLDGTIQGIMVKEKLQPGHHWDMNRVLDPLWILGLYLPGSYQHPNIDNEVKIISVVNAWTPAILRITSCRLSEWLNNAMEDALLRFTDDCFVPALSLRPVTSPASCIEKLLDQAKRESTALKLKVGVGKVLKRLPSNNLNLPGCQDLLQCLEDGFEQPSVLDSFTADVTRRLDCLEQASVALAELPPLTDEDMATLLEERSTTAEAQRIAGEKNGTDNGQRAEYGRMYLVLEKYARKKITPQPKVFCKWSCPTGGPLMGNPPARFDEGYWSSFDKLGQHDFGGKYAQERSAEFPPSTAVNDTQNYKRCIRYLDLLLETQTVEEKADYDVIVERMAALSSRSFEKTGPCVPWSSNVRDDNWWHIRRLVQMLVQRYALEHEMSMLVERRLMLVFAAIEGGYTEAVLWLIPLEGLLKGFSRYISMRNNTHNLPSETELAIQQELLRELTTFCHGLAATNLILRFHVMDPRSSSKSRMPKDMNLAWYTMVFNVKSACHLRSCHRLLPHPRLTSEKCERGALLVSIGTDDARTGSSRARSFISTDRGRGGIYPCLVSWHFYREPHPALLSAFLWFAGIYHKACKALRGKFKENF
ncbi:hypothetical protein IFR04_012330 [Cadophora malorum]|uniref:Uncharacterized protein n=1 Tax=Cadophora malorum TaxID=108018 RepID=A0A8H7T3H5_9HELO|nr:hypothetical protein IFR04_012330 [Cadophora malorum]